MLDLFVLAQSAPDIPPWVQNGGFGALLSLVIWYVWYQTSVHQPKIHERNQQHVEKVTAEHRQTITTIVEEFRAENKEHRQACVEEKKMLWNQLHNRHRTTGAES